jgi:hypothetical protein
MSYDPLKDFGWGAGGSIFDEIESGKNPLKEIEQAGGKDIDVKTGSGDCGWL